MILNRRQILLILLLRRRQRHGAKRRSPRFWVRAIFAQRKIRGELHLLVQEMKLGDHELFFKQFRMLLTKFEELLGWVGPRIVKSNIKRESISPEERLFVTLRYLASGDSQTTISTSYRISQSTTGRIIAETTEVIWDILTENSYLDVPETENDWMKIAREFEVRWNFPHCLGAIDGKYIVMQAPEKSGSLFFLTTKSNLVSYYLLYVTPIIYSQWLMSVKQGDKVMLVFLLTVILDILLTTTCLICQ